jgi:hypothetical protein
VPDVMAPNDEMYDLLRACASANPAVAGPALAEVAKAALETPLREGVIDGDITSDIFVPEKYLPNQMITYPLDFVDASLAGDIKAFQIPDEGRIPEFAIRGNEISCGTYNIGAAVDFPLQYLEAANWNIMPRVLEVLDGMFVRKFNADAWHVLLASAASRNLLVTDTLATAGLFSKRLFSLIKIAMRRNAGGNSNSVNRGKLTRLYVSPEAAEDPLTWDHDEADDVTRRQIFVNEGIVQFGTLEVRAIDELGVGQEFEDYLVNTLGAAHTDSKVEYAFGLDLSRRNSFVMPWRKEIEVYEDMMLHRSNRAGFYGRCNRNYLSLDSRRCILAQL